MNTNEFTTEELTREEVIARMGEPHTEGEMEFPGIGTGAVDTLVYFHLDSDEKGLPGDMAPFREQTLMLADDVVVGSWYSSSYAGDSTQFEIENADLIVDGLSKEEVIELIGEPSGKSIGENRDLDISTYTFSRLADEKRQLDMLIIQFDENKTVVAKQIVRQ